MVLLDEATAFVDPESEAVIQSSINELIQGKTLIVIAHRLSTVTGADQIIVLNNGCVEAKGTHQELLQTCALYERMWRAQQGDGHNGKGEDA